MKQFEDKEKDSWMANEPSLGYTQMESRQSVLMDYDKIIHICQERIRQLEFQQRENAI